MTPFKPTQAQQNLQRDTQRQQVRRARQGLSLAQRQAAERAIHQALFAHPAFQRAQGVHCYVHLPDEVNTHPIFAVCQRLKKRCYVPIQQASQTLSFAPYTLGQPLSKKGFGVLEPPVPSQALNPALIDLVLVPALAFAPNGMRLGSGKGFYDRWLASLKTSRRDGMPTLIGLGYALQLLPSIVQRPHDVLLDWIITENVSISCHP